MDARKSGTAGRRKRGSWCGMRERRRVAETAEMSGRVAVARERFLRGRRNRDGPRRVGRETRRCW